MIGAARIGRPPSLCIPQRLDCEGMRFTLAAQRHEQCFILCQPTHAWQRHPVAWHPCRITIAGSTRLRHPPRCSLAQRLRLPPDTADQGSEAERRTGYTVLILIKEFVMYPEFSFGNLLSVRQTRVGWKVVAMIRKARVVHRINGRAVQERAEVIRVAFFHWFLGGRPPAIGSLLATGVPCAPRHGFRKAGVACRRYRSMDGNAHSRFSLTPNQETANEHIGGSRMARSAWSDGRDMGWLRGIQKNEERVIRLLLAKLSQVRERLSSLFASLCFSL